MTPLKIFIASSSEGMIASDAIEAELEDLTVGKAEIKHWKTQFQLSQAYIESLETLVSTCDIGIFVLTADDLLRSRNKKQEAPRDNVIFELGLFMGGLGRSRCFMFVEKKENNTVRTPSDLLGLERLEFIRPTDGNWKNILTKGCKRVLKQAFMEGVLYRLPENVKHYVDFREKLQGHWWEKIDNAEGGILSFFSLKPDEAFNAVKIEGTSYAPDGRLSARWESKLVTLIPKEEKLIYHWEGRKLNEANVSFSGFGEMKFDIKGLSGDSPTGHGHFFNINEARINESLFKTIMLKKETTDSIAHSMQNDPESKKISIVQRVLKNW